MRANQGPERPDILCANKKLLNRAASATDGEFLPRCLYYFPPLSTTSLYGLHSSLFIVSAHDVLGSPPEYSEGRTAESVASKYILHTSSKMGLDNDTRGWVMSCVSGIGGCYSLEF